MRRRHAALALLAALVGARPALALADATGAEVVQVIGRKATLFRDNPDLEWKGNVPPWR